MTITWRRLGFLGFIIPMVFWAIAARGWGVGNMKALRVAMILAAVVVFALGAWLNAEGPDDDGKARHHAFGLPMQWPVVPGVAMLLSFL